MNAAHSVLMILATACFSESTFEPVDFGYRYLADRNDASRGFDVSGENSLIKGSSIKSETISFFVSPDGNDSWSGRLQRPNTEKTDGPFATLQAARNAAREVDPKHPCKIIMLDGEYFLEQPVVFDGRDNGLTVTVAPDARVVLYGGRRITGWEKDGEKFYAVELPGVKEGEWDFRSLVVNGRFCMRARLPETGTFEHLSEFDVNWMSTTGGGWQRKPTEEELTTLKFKPGDIGSWFAPENAEVTVYHMWDESTVGVSSIDHNNHIMTFSSPTGHPAGAFRVKKYAIWNLRQGMTEPGQWYLDRTAGKLVYWPLPGEDMTEARVIAPTAESIIRIQGQRDEPVRDITIEGIALSVTTTPLISGGFGAGRFAGAMDVSNAVDCSLNNLEIFNVAGQGINVRNGKISIERCHIHDVGACGVRAASCYVTDNHIHHIGLIYPSAIGLVGGGRDGVFSHNEIHDTPYTAINCGGHRNHIEHNHIYRAMKVLHDGGGIYCFAGQGLRLRGNFIHDIDDTGGYGSSAYYLDERSENCLVEGNLSVDVARPSHNHMALKNTIRNNVFIFQGDARITFPKSSDYILEKNVIYATGKITFANSEAISTLRSNLIFSGKGEIIARQTGDQSDSDSEFSVLDMTNIIADPILIEFRTGKVTFGANSPVHKLDIQSLDVSGAGPR